MPDRATIAAATPRCTATVLLAGQPTACDRMLAWHHDKGLWACRVHGDVLSMEKAAERLAQAVR